MTGERGPPLYFPEVPAFPGQAKMVLHKTVNGPRTGTAHGSWQIPGPPAGRPFLLHMAQKVKPVRIHIHAVARPARRSPAGSAADMAFVHHKLPSARKRGATQPAPAQIRGKAQSTGQAQTKKKAATVPAGRKRSPE